MIDVKSFRPDAARTAETSDPLSPEPPEQNNARVLGAWLGGLMGLGLYLRSFLWTDVAAAAGPEAAAPAPETEPESLTSQRRKAATPQETAPDDDAPAPGNDSAEADPAAARFGYPMVLGRLDAIFLEPLALPAFGITPRVFSNSLFPPYRSFRGTFEQPAGNPETTTPADRSGPAATDDPGTGRPRAAADDPEQPDEAPETPEPGRNRAPRNSGAVVLGDVGSGAALALSLSQLLSRTEDPDGDPLTVSMDDNPAAVLLPGHDGWLYLADTAFLGEVTISYTITDGEARIAQTAILNLVENVLTGSDGDDLILGTRGRDVIAGLDGDDNLAGLGGQDRIHGAGGDDNISGGDGDDHLWGGDGDDLISGGRGDDWISGGAGNDRLFGEEGNDTIEGGAGDDEIAGGAGDDLLSGGDGQDRISGGAGDDVVFADLGHDTVLGDAGDDLLFGGAGDDLLDGGTGDDILTGGEGRDRLFGGTGNDILSGDEGADTLRGGAGDDVVLADNDAADDSYDGDAGFDRLDYSAATMGVAFDLITGTATGESTGTDRFANFEHLVGSPQGDHFRAAQGAGALTGNGGSDIYDFLQGDTVDIIRSVYRIDDFDHDDRIWISAGSNHREIRKQQKSLEERIEDDLEDLAESINADEPRLTYRYDWTDSYRRTVIEVDFDRDKVIDLELRIEGEHIIVVENI